MADKNYKDMKKYRLIKWYPSLHNHWKKGDIAVESNNETPIYFGKKLTNTLYATISSKEVENNPEFWEEVLKKDKDYEILAFKHNKTGCIFSKTKNSLFLNDPNPCIEDFDKEKVNFSDDGWTLWSVKRISDGEVFTIDKYVENTQYPQKHQGKINKFILDGDTVRVYYSFGWDRLKSVSNCKQPVLTTVDGVNIFEGDIYWWVTEDNEICGGTATKYSGLPENKEFSTKEAAEEYILMNKPCLSINDIKQYNNLGVYENLIELVKSKLE